MSQMRATSNHRNPKGIPDARKGGFTLVELLTVIFIISLLIGLLIPALNAARNAAKNAATGATINAIRVALDLFKNDHEKDFPRTHGFPPSFAHPELRDGALSKQESLDGRFPFVDEKPRVFGAQWLPAMLMGVDRQGYVRPKSVPSTGNLRNEPWKWYEPPPNGPDPALERSPLYLDPSATKTIATEKIPGRANHALFPDWDKMKQLPVIVDSFGQPVLYYVAQANGRTTNMVAREFDQNNAYNGGPQEDGPPIYLHQDNHGFTGHEEDPGWDFGGGLHAIARDGDNLTAADITLEENRDTFARFILDRKLYDAIRQEESPPVGKPLIPVNADTYLLISAGVDGRYGTTDDVTNFSTEVE